MTEDWKPIPGYGGHYEASDAGMIRSKDRVVEQLNCYGTTSSVKYRGRTLISRPTKVGYHQVTLRSDGISKTINVHRVVATIFLPRVAGKPEVNHKDGNKNNNSASNLEWCTSSENKIHAIATGLREACPFGDGSYNFRGTIEVISAGGAVVETLTGDRDIKSKGFTSCGVSSVLTGRQKTHRGFTFRRIGDD